MEEAIMDTLEALEKNGPWLGMSQLVELTGKDPATLRAELKELSDKGLVQKVGQKRGTKYALATTETPNQEDVDYKAEILRLMEEAKARVSRKQLCESIGTYDAKIRPSLLALVESGEVKDNGKKKGQLFWLAAHEAAGLIEEEPEPQKEEEKPLDEEEEEQEICEIEELIQIGLNSAKFKPPYYALSLEDLKNHIFTCAKHRFGHMEVFDSLKELLRKGKLPRLKYEMRNLDSGNRAYFWMEPEV